MARSSKGGDWLNKIICGDALTVLREMPDNLADTCVTSPPYYGLRDYGITEQIGLEISPQAYVERLTDVFREVRRVLKPTGTMWLNIADSYAGSGKGAWNKPPADRPGSKQSYLYARDNPAARMPKIWRGVKAKDMIGIPWMLAFALREDGWYLRSDVIWQKPNVMPESVTDRPTQSYEHVFLLSKSPQYYYDHAAIMEPAIDKRNRRDIWTIPTKSFKGAHFATYPVALAALCIIAGSPENGIVLDPFAGSGTTGVAALQSSREYICIDLNPDYCVLAKSRVSCLDPHAII